MYDAGKIGLLGRRETRLESDVIRDDDRFGVYQKTRLVQNARLAQWLPYFVLKQTSTIFEPFTAGVPVPAERCGYGTP
jgi:hypothetical protein